jgi:hypothetical protein
MALIAHAVESVKKVEEGKDEEVWCERTTAISSEESVVDCRDALKSERGRKSNGSGRERKGAPFRKKNKKLTTNVCQHGEDICKLRGE